MSVWYQFKSVCDRLKNCSFINLFIKIHLCPFTQILKYFKTLGCWCRFIRGFSVRLDSLPSRAETGHVAHSEICVMSVKEAFWQREELVLDQKSGSGLVVLTTQWTNKQTIVKTIEEKLEHEDALEWFSFFQGLHVNNHVVLFIWLLIGAFSLCYNRLVSPKIIFIRDFKKKKKR